MFRRLPLVDQTPIIGIIMLGFTRMSYVINRLKADQATHPLTISLFAFVDVVIRWPQCP